jgi:hypothetical protein
MGRVLRVFLRVELRQSVRVSGGCCCGDSHAPLKNVTVITGSITYYSSPRIVEIRVGVINGCGEFVHTQRFITVTERVCHRHQLAAI